MSTANRRPACGMCTFKCVSIAYGRAPWFRLIREPMIMGMRYFAAVHRVRQEVAEFPFPTSSCQRCIRFYKTVLFRHSKSFRWLHGRMNPIFNHYMDRIVTAEERKKANQYALAASAGTLTEAQTAEWMKGMKTGL